MTFLYRKIQRWDCGVFVKYSIYEKLNIVATIDNKMRNEKIYGSNQSFFAFSQTKHNILNEDDVNRLDSDLNESIVEGYVSVTEKCFGCTKKQYVRLEKE